MDDVTQQNAALVEQAAAAESLEEQAQSLSATVSQFKIDGYSHARNGMLPAKFSSSFSAAPLRKSTQTQSETTSQPLAAKPKPILQSLSNDWEEF